MLESLAAWVLNTYIGEYLENLNTDQLSVALLQGQVELENVPLKRTALRKFDIPLTVKSGVLGKLTLSVPLTHMRSEPWVVKISDLHVLLEPSENKYDVEFDERYEQGKKQQQLEALEAFHKKQLLETAGLPAVNELSAAGGHGGGWFNAYSAPLVSAIVENIQLILTNVHIRYEDGHTLGGGRSFTAGVRIKRVTVQTTNAFWKPGFVQPNENSNLYKVLELTGLSVYWNSGQQCSGDIATYRELMSLLVPDNVKDNSYVLEPASAQVRMEKNTAKFPLKSKPPIPRFRFDLEPDKVAIEMTKRQLAELRLLGREWGRYDRARRHRKWRPKEGVHGHARTWWHFAYHRLLDETRRAREKRTMHYMTTRAKHLNAYCRAYRRRLEMFLEDAERMQKVAGDSSQMRASSSTHSHRGDELDAVLMKQIENDAQYTYEELHLFRDTVFRRVLDGKAVQRKSSTHSAPTDDQFVSIGDELESPRSARSDTDLRSAEADRPPESAGLYGWFSSWFTASTDAQALQSPSDSGAEKVGSSSDLSMWPPFSDQQRPELPPYLRRLEKQLEEEIMDVLNESLDDSTLLRRDALLAQIRLRMRTFTIRFVDEEVSGGVSGQASMTKILALELSDAHAQVRLSPRHHSTAVSLTVGDLSVQRLQVHKSQWSASSDQEESLMYGFNESDVNTTVLFALGKSPSAKRNHTGPINVHGREPPLLRMVYERRAPRLIARHTLDAEFSPITIMYHEDAPVGLSDLFETDLQPLEEYTTAAVQKPMVSDLSTHLFATIRVPEVTVELRSKQLSFGGDKSPHTPTFGAGGKPFACAHFHRVMLGVANTEDWITEIKIGVAGFELEDLLETDAVQTARYLFKAGCFECPTTLLGQSQFLSSSCPDLTSTGNDYAPYSSSLPPRAREVPISIHSPTLTPERTPKISRKASLAAMDGFGELNQTQCFVTVSLIDSRHPRFDSLFAKVGCCIRAKLADLDIGMNRQTWTVMLDFLGIIAPAPAPVGQEDDIAAVKQRSSSTTKDSGHTELQLAVQAFRVHMNQPTDGVQLGTITLGEVTATVLADDADQLTIVGSAVSLAVDDKTPFYSQLYSQRIVAMPGLENAKLQVIKYGRPDPNLLRECDMTVSVKVNAPGTAYVHTHRYFCALLDYWMYFFQLQDVMTQQKSAMAGQKISDRPSHGTRVLLNVDVEGPLSLVLPLNQLSTQAIVAETSSIHISNRFVFASEASKEADVLSTADCTDETHDCLLDEMTVVCADLSLHDAEYIGGEMSARSLPVGRRKTADFGSFFLSRSEHNALDKPYQLVVQVFRNLDGAFAHNVPDLSVAVSLSDVRCRLTLDFYKLVRGFLERNLGDELPPAMVAPVECRPTGGFAMAHGTLTYATFSYRMSLRNVKLDCLLMDATTGAWAPFGRVDLDHSRMSFDVYTDGNAELDLICHETALVDSRFEEVAANNRPNAFPKILCSNPQRLTAASVESGLMSEAHLMLSPNEPPKVTLLLADARVLLLLDWLNTAKDFILSSSDFVPPVAPSKRALLVRAPGLVTRRVSVEPAEPNIELKINLRESDLVLLEDPSSRNSLALVAQTTAVLALRDIGGILKCLLEIQSVRLSSCVMAAFVESQCQLTNSFAATFDLRAEELKPISRQARTLAPGLPGLYEARHKLGIEVSELIARLSYRDYLVVHSVLTSSIDRLKQSVTESAVPMPKHKTSGATGGLLIDKVSFKTDQMSLWLLDDYQDTGFPLVRATFSDVMLDQALHSCPMTGMASLKLACDYFNQRVFGWEPLIEPWNLQWLSWQWHSSKSKLGVDIRSDNTSTLDLNLTQAFLQQAIQFSGRWSAVKEALDKDFRSACSRARSDHLPYLLKNDTGSDLLYTTAVADVESARVENRKPTVRWTKVTAGEQCSFAFPTRRLTFARDDSESRQMIVQVDGWDEISPVNVDSVGTYFRIARFANSTKQSSLSRVSNARLVVAVSMDQDGRKVVTVRSALTLVNGLPDPIEIHLDNHSMTFFGDICTLIIPPREARPTPLKYAMAKMGVRPKGHWAVERHETVDWQNNKDVGVTTNRTITCIDANNLCYRMCVSVKCEHYPQQQVGHEMLPGHTITFMPPLTVVNLLPTDVEFSLPAYRRFDCIPAGQELLLTAVDMSTSVEFSVSTDLFRTLRNGDGKDRQYDFPEVTLAAAIEGRQLRLRMNDGHQRPLDLYVSISLGKAGAVRMSLWVPYWIVNKSGIPLIIKQDSSGADDAAGQFDEHESAKDKSSLMFSFANDNCPYQCVARIGKKYIDGLSPKYSRKFHLTPGIQEMKLVLESSNNSRSAEVYSIGVEVRQGQGRYKDTQVVLFTPRYVLANRTAHKLIVAQKGFTDNPDKNIAIAPNCHFVWHWASESVSIGPDARMLCLKRDDLKHWSCPFQIDTLRSFHLNIRDADDTPRFLRVEIVLSSAVFCVTVTDAEYFPPPIRIENRTDVPIIYQQQSISNDSHFHLRTICKAQSSVDYAWDDLYAPERLTLQVFETKSQTYDLKVLGQGAPLVYDNDMYIRLTSSFKQPDYDHVGRGDERELVLEALAQGKVVLNKYNPVDSSRSQLWRLTREGHLENVGLNQRSTRATIMVLDVLDSHAERSNYPLMMKARNPARDHYQIWTFTEDGRLCCRLPELYVQSTAQFDAVLGPTSPASKVASGVPREQHWTKQKQRPGSGRLNVECLHEGPTQVLRITDWVDDRRVLSRRAASMSTDCQTLAIEVNIFMDKGVGLSLVNGLFEELVYCRLEGILVFGKIENGTYSLTGQVMQIQTDNQLLTAEQWPVLYCRAKQSDEPNKYEVIPALRLEMRWTPMQHYDAFDCFRANLRKISVKLDENLLWKLVQFMQMSGAESVQPALLLQPPNTELTRPDTLKARRCYFGTLELGCDMVYLSVLAVAASSLAPDLRRLKQQFNVKLVSFENASVKLPPFRQSHYFETFPFLLEAIQKHFAGELQGHALRILGTVDFLGNPIGLAVDVADGLQDLVMEGSVGTLVSNVGYGLSNSISKISSSVADGVGALTFDEQHETARRKALRYQPTTGSSAALGHLYTGVKGLGVGVIGGLTSIVRNTYDGSRKEGVSGAIVGLGTGAIATVTKPVQGIFDLVGGTASAVKEMVGGPSRKARFADSRIRLPRVTRNLQSLLPCYSETLADAQQQLLRINGYNTNETCLSVEPCSISMMLKSQMYALICSEQCYIVRQTEDEPNVVTMRISYKNLKEVRAVDDLSGRGYLEVISEQRPGYAERLPKLWCSKTEYARQLSEKILRAKQLHDHSKRTLVVAEDFSLDLI